MPKFYRVRDEETGHEFTTALKADHLTILADEPAVDSLGKPLPAKPKQPKGVDDMSVDELKAEIGRLNQSREEADHIPASGNKAALVAALKKAQES